MTSKLKNIFTIMNQNRPELGLLVTPSWLSGLICIVLSLVIVAGAVFSVQYKGSNLQLLRESQIKQTQTVDNNLASVDNSLATSQLVSDIPLLILWGGVGFVAYVLTMNIAGAFKKAVDFEQQLGYVHANREHLIHEAVARAVIRSAFLVIWLFYWQFTRHVLLPYAVALAYAGAGAAVGWQAAGYLLMSGFVLAVGLHLHVILLRLVLLKSRLFGA